jgi:hypothetical protein
MDELLLFGARVLLAVVKQSVEAETRRNEEAYKRVIAESVYREYMRARVHDAVRARERRAAIERLRLASSDPQWQQRIDQLLETMAGG